MTKTSETSDTVEHFFCQELGLGIVVGLHQVCIVNLDSREINDLGSRGSKKKRRNVVEHVLRHYLEDLPGEIKHFHGD